MAASKVDDWLTEDGLLKLQGWARDGLIEKQIAKNMGVSYCGFRVWKKEHPEIAEAIRKGKEVVDREVENTLFKSATGFIGPDGRYYPPNVTAQIFWLKNRKPDKWREKNDVAISPSNGVLESIMALEQKGKKG
jgi:hypothetical protein